MSLSRPLLLAILVSSFALVAVSAQIVTTRTGSKSAALPDTVTKSASVPDSAARSVIDNLDALVQKRFETVARIGGISRIVDLQMHHPDVVYAEKPDEKRLLAAIKTLQRPYEVCFFHYKPLQKTLKPARAGRVISYRPEARFSSNPVLVSLTAEPTWKNPPGISAMKAALSPGDAYQWWLKGMKTHQDELKQIVAAHIPALERGESASTVYRNDWYMETRPVIAHSAECLTCHTNVQKGATMAAMVYLVKKNGSGDPTHSGKVWSDFARQP